MRSTGKFLSGEISALLACEEGLCLRDSRAVTDALVPALIFYHWDPLAQCFWGHLGNRAP